MGATEPPRLPRVDGRGVVFDMKPESFSGWVRLGDIVAARCGSTGELKLAEEVTRMFTRPAMGFVALWCQLLFPARPNEDMLSESTRDGCHLVDVPSEGLASFQGCSWNSRVVLCSPT
mmetsp:Transcript_28732/g.72718  ORF Transcript_28732/g.72718 Transcript_28732/m.72718 type:complete len:118 (+) Transcript_28732:111-464(+)